MPRFSTISPTHIEGKKEFAWKNFLKGGYIAIGWLNIDLTGMSIDEVVSLIRKEKFDNEASAIDAFRRFFLLDIGDYIAVNNANAGLFGVGIIKSGYKFDEFKHDTGAENQDEFYSNLRMVEWKYTDYISRKELIGPDETGWQPYGTIGAPREEVPPYIKRLLGEAPQITEEKQDFVAPEYLRSLIKLIEHLESDPGHQERAHESLVEDFLCLLGFEKHKDIKYRQGRVDISIAINELPMVVIEVKRDWDLSIYKDYGSIKQAYQYALDQGARYVIITNGDNYIIFDRLKGLALSSNIVGEFRLTALKEDDLKVNDKLRRDSLLNPNLEELFLYLSESFRRQGL